ncbi:MAG: flavin reductase family protein [Saprospiraceae bacterium]|nr:flavin reductase family protein [Saprospiraceae bacterium]
MNKSKILNIIMAIIILVLLLAGRDSVTPAARIKSLFKKTTHVNTSEKVYTKRSLGEKNLVFPEPAMVIGSYDKDGVPNIMTAAWFGVANSKPLKVSVSLRPATYSYHCIMANMAFTVNVPDASLISYVTFAGKYSGKDMNKFEETGLTPVKSEYVNAPYIKEFPIVLECKVTEYHDLGSHRQFIGQVIDAKIDDRLLNEDGEVDMDLFNPIIYGQGKYYSGLDLIQNINEIVPKVKN